MCAPLFFLLYFWAFWSVYVLVMAFYRPYLLGQLKGAALYMAAPWLALGVMMDVVANVLCTAVFLEPPREWMVTTRLTRYLTDPLAAPWRKHWADVVCGQLLDYFDPRGRHCVES